MISFDPIIRVDHGLWGLNDRDVPIKRGDQPYFVGHLVGDLRRRGRGIHFSELAGITQEIRTLTPSIIVSLATTDDRVRYSDGQFLFLTEWGSPRRESLIDVMRRVLEAGGTFSTEEIVARVTPELQRTPTNSAVYSCLRNLGATFSEVEQGWVVVQGPPVPDDDWIPDEPLGEENVRAVT
jgi:hypothetical protein